MEKLSRRAVLLQATAALAAGAAVTGAAAPVLATPADSRSPRPGTQPEGITASGPIVAYVREGRAGEVRLLVGEREIVRSDPGLAQALAAAAAS